MTNLIKRSKRGYAYQVPGGEFPGRDNVIIYASEYTYDPMVDALFRQYREIIGQTIPSALILKLVERLKQLIGRSFSDWMWLQVSTNQAVHGDALHYLKDCILFTQTGYRTLDITVWGSLIETDPAISEIVIDERKRLFNDIPIPSLDVLLSDWLSQKDGANDLFTTAHLLFGNSN